MNKKNELLLRVYTVLLLFVIVALVMVFRVFQVSVLEGEKWRKIGERNTMKVELIEGERGDVLAEDGRLLLTSNQFFEIRMDPVASISNTVFNSRIDSLAFYLSRYSDISKSRMEWKELLKSKRRAYLLRKERGTRNVQLARNLDYDGYRKFKAFPILRKGGIKGGMIVIPKVKRDRPYGEVASRLLGLDRENASKIGLEAYCDDYLSGDSVSVLMKKMPMGEWVPFVDIEDIEADRGADVLTTLDVELSEIVHTELMKGVKKHNAKAGTAILMDVKTGQIKAMSNLKKMSSGEYHETYNYAIAEISEPGSTFKAATALALLEDGVDVNTLVDLEGGVAKFHDLLMRDSERHGERVKSMKYAFVKSSNIGMAKLAVKHFGSRSKAGSFIKYLDEFGLTEKTSIEVPGEGNPNIKHPKKDSERWYGTTIPWMAHGYELGLSPLQILSFYNTVANDGRRMKPYVVKAIIEKGEVVKTFKPRVLNKQIASIESINILQSLLEDVVNVGTARRLKTEKYDFAGKTGTTTVNYNKKGIKEGHNSSFAGYFPAESPKYSLIVVVYEPVGKYYGATVAGPIFRGIADNAHIVKESMNKPTESDDEVHFASLIKRTPGYAKDIREVLAYVDVGYKTKSKSNWINSEMKNDIVVLTKKKFSKDIIPDVRGMGLRDAMYVLENMGLDVQPHGMGKVYKQTLLPGTTLKNQEIELYLN